MTEAHIPSPVDERAASLSSYEFCVVFSTCPPHEANTLAREIVGARLAACVNVFPTVRSTYIWKDEFCSEEESLLLMKTTYAQLHQLVARVKELHPYEVPEIIALPIVEGQRSYLDWIRETTGNLL